MVDKKTKVELSFDSGATYTDLTSYLVSWVYNGELNNQADRLTLKLKKSVKDTYDLNVLYSIKVYEGWTTATDRLIFKGVITRIVDEYSTLLIDCADEIYKLLKARKVAVYNRDTSPQAGVLSAIAEDLMDEVVPTTVESSGTDITLSQYVVSNKTNILERVTTLANVLDYIILYDPEVDSAYFVSKDYFTNSNVLTLPENVTERPKWDKDATKLFNDLTFIGGTSSGVRSELYNGDGIETDFEVELTPTDSVLVEVYVGSDWVEQKQGTPGVSLTYDYYIDKFNKKIVFTTASIPASGTDNVRITISAQIPPIVHLTNEESILEYNIGQNIEGELVGIKETIIEDDVTSNEDAKTRANNLLSVYSIPFYSTSVKLKAEIDRDYDYKLGEKISVIDTDIGLSQDFIITSVKRQFPGVGAEISVGDKAHRLGQLETNLKKRLEKLEERLSGDYELLADYKNASTSFTLFAKSTKLTANSVAGDYGIWDHPIYGIWDTSKWAPDTDAETGGFILGHEIYGILGTSKLGAGIDNNVILYDEDYE